MPRVVRLKPQDNLVLAVDALNEGVAINGVTARQAIPPGHKMAVRDIAKGDAILKYGAVIGYAGHHVHAGDWLHEHNVVMPNGVHAAANQTQQAATLTAPSTHGGCFMGFKRPDGRFGTRNYVAVLSSVNCSATVVRRIVDMIDRSGELEDYPNVDGIIPITHNTGCGLDSQGVAYGILNRTLWGYANHPNVGGTLVVGLGCETMQIPAWLKTHHAETSATFRTMSIQGVGGTAKTVDAGIEAVREMITLANQVTRTPAPLAALSLGLQCGGSDGYSGVTANPALGAAVDILVAEGGTAILSETPEIYGAEHLLTNRASNPDVIRHLQERIAWWEEHTRKNDMEMNNNPSPGNKAGGLTTILEKSLGAVAKSGSSPLKAVFNYADPIIENGLVFMDTPGYDPVSATGQVAGGANVMCFTTGRGSAFGCKPTPCLKLASNSKIYAHMSDDMDINCGDILDGVAPDAKGREIFDRIVEVASGGQTKSELLGYGDNEFIPWSIGSTM